MQDVIIHNYRGLCDDQKFVKGTSKIKSSPLPHSYITLQVF